MYVYKKILSIKTEHPFFQVVYVCNFKTIKLYFKNFIFLFFLLSLKVVFVFFLVNSFSTAAKELGEPPRGPE